MPNPRVLVLARNYPNNAFPTIGVWAERFVAASTAVARPTVVAPVPYAPPLVGGDATRRFRSIARTRMAGDVVVHHLRIPVGPGQLLHAFDARLGLAALRGRVIALHRAEPFDLIHAHFIYPDGVIASWIGKELGIPVVSSEHSMWRPWLDRHPAVRRQVDRALPNIARLTAVSQALRQTIVELFDERVPVDIVPNVVDERTFVLPSADEPRDPNHLLFVGLIRRVKGLDVLVRALGQLAADHPRLHLSVVGATFFRAYEREAAEVRALVTSLGLEKRVTFLGELPPNEVARLMRQSALLVVPSRRETFSLVTAEALASGTPVVATRCGGPEEILTPETGILADVDDPASLASAIEETLGRSYDAARMRHYAVTQFGTAVAAERLGRLYDRVTAASGATSTIGAPATGSRLAV
jgi:glycosyltransferase involved in cell wall biosynthesis